MKKILALILALTMVFALCACGTPAAAPTETPFVAPTLPPEYAAKTLDELKAELTTVAEGKLTVATSPDFAPYEFYAVDDSGNAVLAGFDPALAQYIADFVGLELEMVPMDFDGILAELQTKNVDLGMSGFSPKPDRANSMDFSSFYYMGGQSFVTSKAKAEAITDLASANKAEYSIGAQNGSIQADLAAENTPDSDIVLLTKVTDIIAEVVSGKLDGAFIETAVAENYAKQFADLVIVCEVPYDQEGSVVGVVKDNPALWAVVNMAIAAALEDGSMAQFVVEANELSTGETIEPYSDEYNALLEAVANAG